MDTERECISRIIGVHLSARALLSGKNGTVMHMLRSSDKQFDVFGEIYFSTLDAGAIKAWKKHEVMTQNIVVPTGLLKVVVVDLRINSPTYKAVDEYILGRPDNYSLLTIPPLVWYGYQNLLDTEAVIANSTSIQHDQNEMTELPAFTDEIDYSWSENV